VEYGRHLCAQRVDRDVYGDDRRSENSVQPANPFASVQVNGSGGYYTMQDSMTVNFDDAVTAGTLDTGGQAILLKGYWTTTAYI